MILCDCVLCALFMTPHLQRSFVRQTGEVDRVYGEGEGGGAGGQPAGRVVPQVQRARHHQQVHVETRLGDNSYIVTAFDCNKNHSDLPGCRLDPARLSGCERAPARGLHHEERGVQVRAGAQRRQIHHHVALRTLGHTVWSTEACM